MKLFYTFFPILPVTLAKICVRWAQRRSDSILESDNSAGETNSGQSIDVDTAPQGGGYVRSFLRLRVANLVSFRTGVDSEV